MKTQMFDMMRVWAAMTGLALAAWYFAAMHFGFSVSELLPMLVTAIGGFELSLFGRDRWLGKKRSEHG